MLILSAVTPSLRDETLFEKLNVILFSETIVNHLAKHKIKVSNNALWSVLAVKHLPHTSCTSSSAMAERPRDA